MIGGLLPLLGGLLGASSSGGGTQTSTTAPWSEQQPYLQQLFERASEYLQGPASPDFSTIAQFDPAQMAAQQGLLSYAGGGLQNMIGQGQQGLGQMLSATPNMDVWGPVMQEAARVPTRAFQEQVLPSIRSGAQMAGQYGGSRQGIAEGIASRGLSEALAGQQVGLAQTAASEALQQRRSGMGMLPMMAGLGQMPYQLQSQVGAQRQGMEQAQLSEQAQQFYAPLQQLQAFQGLIGGGYGGTQSTPYYGNPMLGGLAGMMMGNQFGGMLGNMFGGGDPMAGMVSSAASPFMGMI